MEVAVELHAAAIRGSCCYCVYREEERRENQGKKKLSRRCFWFLESEKTPLPLLFVGFKIADAVLVLLGYHSLLHPCI
ncbi:hypothetical protein AHAS_Ahas20G0214500 [Arachis hypogaea]